MVHFPFMLSTKFAYADEVKLSQPGTPKAGKMKADDRVIELNLIKQELHLTTRNIVDYFKDQGFKNPGGEVMTANSISSYLQGDVLDPELIERLLFDFRNMKNHLSKKYDRFLQQDMRAIIDGWYSKLGITGGSKERKLAELFNLDHSRIFVWYSRNQFPKSMMTVLYIDQKIMEYQNPILTAVRKAKIVEPKAHHTFNVASEPPNPTEN